MGLLAAPAPRAQAAADNTRGMALMAAKINPDGAFAYGSGVVANYKFQGGPGRYSVEFDRFVDECFYSVTPATLARSAVAEPVVNFANRVSVTLRDGAGAYVDDAFYLTVFCHK